MAQLLTLSRAARLVGVSRGALQRKVKDGELASFDGMIAVEDLQAAYPDFKTEDELLLERVNKIKDDAFAKRVRERVLPPQDVLARRLFEQSRELADVKTHLQRYHTLLTRLQERMREIGAGGDGRLRAAIADLDDWIAQQLGEVLDTEAPHPLAVMDDYLRLVSAHVDVRPSGHDFFVEGRATLLEAGVKAGLALNYGCSDGSCGLCKARVVSGETQQVRHHDYLLSETERNTGYVLMCCHAPLSDLILEALEASGPEDIPFQEIAARVKAWSSLSGDMNLLRLDTPHSARLRFLAGQNVALESGNLTAEYPLANCPCEPHGLQVHVRDDPDDEFRRRVLQDLREGDTLIVRGPAGRFVLPAEPRRPLLFLAWEDGFAPVKGVLEQAVAANGTDPIYLYWGAARADGLYLENLCRAWADALDDFHFRPVADEVGGIEALLDAVAQDHATDLKRFDIYVAGPASFTEGARQWLLQRAVPAPQITTWC